jgi:hypothetical protein
MNLGMKRVFIASITFILVLSLITVLIPAFAIDKSFLSPNNRTADNFTDNNINASVTFSSRTQEGRTFLIGFHLNYLNSSIESQNAVYTIYLKIPKMDHVALYANGMFSANEDAWIDLTVPEVDSHTSGNLSIGISYGDGHTILHGGVLKRYEVIIANSLLISDPTYNILQGVTFVSWGILFASIVTFKLARKREKMIK